MNIVPLSQQLIPAVERLIELGLPYVRLRTNSDYWLYATLFSTTCRVALVDDTVVGVVVAFRSQDDPSELYVQDVMTHPGHRQRGIARSLVSAVRDQAIHWGCRRLYLTSEPDNAAAHNAWLSLGFVNVPGDHKEGDVSVISNYKGPGKDRAVYELLVGSR
ncbi:acetyltransferase (GNAT) family protein [Krasilnikovia cinnamomea]|uniref:Acetyltransferase (GNAT) family protein n=1 Tax=Krasilnikovia cinnamomea TaxID=349313 RepID=A0A4Q7ZDL3_9ACTN|nr:GNAT family N-acetyltransferase [Krasilnikovia cinnamomea]RZU48767.1 acetyltransferase (GNAT) family protein [Krasilnikovia cinnamomea]